MGNQPSELVMPSSKIRPMTEIRLLRDAVIKFQAGNKGGARALLDEALEINPNNELVWLCKASLAETSREVIEHLEQVLRIDPGHEKALSWLAGLGDQQGFPEAGDGECPLCGMERNGESGRCPQCRAVTDLKDPDAVAGNKAVRRSLLEQAKGRFEAALREGPGYDAHYNLALIHLNLCHSTQALAHLEAAKRLRPGNPLIAEAIVVLRGRPLILVVDNSVTIRKTLGSILERNRYRTISAGDGLEALSVLREETPNLILLDVMMPRMNGYQVCKRIRRNQNTKRIPVLMISANFVDKMRGRMAGATGYIPRPFKAKMILGVIEKYLPVPVNGNGSAAAL